jgi:hypothetical protein
MQEISLLPQKSQQFTIDLDNQIFVIRLYQMNSAIYLDLAVDDVIKIQGVACLNNTKLLRYRYLKIKGELFFSDIAGSDDPNWRELGSRFKLFYLSSSEL